MATSKDLKIKNGLDVSGPITVPDLTITDDYPTIYPSLTLDFANSKSLDNRITFTRSSTATYISPDGLIKTAAINEPRFDYDPITKVCNGLLIEESRTNLFFPSISGPQTVTTGTIMGPDGVLAQKAIPNAVAQSWPALGYSDTAISLTTGQYQDLSFTGYFIPTSSNPLNMGVEIYFGASPSSVYAEYQVNFTTLTITPTMGAGFTNNFTPIIELMPCGMYKVSVGARYTQGATIRTSLGGGVQLRTSGGVTGVYTGDGISGMHFACMQMEFGNYPTSYIPTTTVPVTRNADLAYMNGTNFSSWHNPNEGTIIAHATFGSPPILATLNRASWSITSINGDSMTNIWWESYMTSSFLSWVNSAWAATISSGQTITSNSFHKIASAYKLNDYATVANNSTVYTDTSGNLPASPDTLWVGSWGTGSFLCGTIAKLSYYPKRLSNTQLQTLTK